MKLLKDIQKYLVKYYLEDGVTLFYKGKKYNYINSQWIQSNGTITDYCNYTNNDSVAIISEGLLGSQLIDDRAPSFEKMVDKNGYYIERVTSWCFQTVQL